MKPILSFPSFLSNPSFPSYPRARWWFSNTLDFFTYLENLENLNYLDYLEYSEKITQLVRFNGRTSNERCQATVSNEGNRGEGLPAAMYGAISAPHVLHQQSKWHHS